jgi:hypothetical protein
MSTNNELSDTQRMLLHAIMFSSLRSTFSDGIFSYDLCGPCQSELFCWQRLKIVILLGIDVCMIVVLAYILSPSRRREAPCEGTNSTRLFTPGETKALAKSKVHQ